MAQILHLALLNKAKLEMSLLMKNELFYSKTLINSIRKQQKSQ